jgi:predicted unusual protein kinase regulating ubiquinone biosynthesis (AarF/ABC1/UbiB family)
MRSVLVSSRLIYLGVSYIWDCGFRGRRKEAGLQRFAVRLRTVMLELGGVYIKLGQLLSTRPDLVEPGIARELEALLDKCPPEPLESSLLTMRENLGLGPTDPLPFEVLGEISSASFGCVYKLRFPSGQVAAIKVMRRGIRKQTRNDLWLMVQVAWLLDLLAVTQRYRTSDWIEQLSQWTSEELDYRVEARKMTYIARGLRRVGGVKIPAVNWKYTTRRILTMEFLNGAWLSNDAGCLSHADRAHAASLLFQAFLFTIFELGYFNADLHKGNLCLLPDGRVGMVDFGITGFVSQRTRLRHLGLVAALQKGAVDEAFASILEIVFVPPDADLGGFKRLFEQEYYDWFLRSVQPNYPAYRRGAGSLMLALFRRAYESRIVVDSDVVRYYRAFSIIDGVVTSLNPQFSQGDEIGRYLKQRLRRQLEDLRDSAFDPIETMVALKTEVAFRTGELRHAIWGVGKSFDSAVGRLLLGVAAVKRALSRVVWGFSLFALLLKILVWLDVLGERKILIRNHFLGKIDVRDITDIIVPLFVTAVVLGWLSRLVRARVYSGTHIEAETARETQGGRR